MLSFQALVQNWCVATFGETVANDVSERRWRFTEEALELVQSLGMTKSEAVTLVDYVFARSAGEPKQELGGVMVTLAALSAAENMDMVHCGEIELNRVSQPEVQARVRAKQEAKVAAGLTSNPLPGDPDAPRNEMTSEDVGRIAARALRNPSSITAAEIQALAGSCLTQRPDNA